MMILHLAACQMGLAAWAETERFNFARAESGAHPFAARGAELRHFLEQTGFISADEQQRGRSSMRATLPSAANMPLPSSPINNLPKPGTYAGLADWLVGVVLPNARECAQLMQRLGDSQRLPDGVTIGQDAAYWPKAIEFALQLTAYGRFLPTVEHDDRHAYARWQPVIEGKDARSFNLLAAAMPASARALSRLNHPTQRNLDARNALRTVIERVVDETVRLGLENVPPVKPVRKRDVKAHNLHDDLVHALTKPGNRRMQGERLHTTTAASQIEAWRRPVNQRGLAPARLCIELRPPDKQQAESAPWTLRFLLQAKHDPQLLVAPEEVNDENRHPLAEPGFRPRRFMQAEIRRAAAISAVMRLPENEALPRSILISNLDAYQFMTKEARLLAENGIVALLPERWDKDGRQLRITADAKLAGNSVTFGGMATLLDFNWRAALVLQPQIV